MTHDVYVFGDSHWRVFFPFVNHGAATDNVSHTQNDIRTIDTIANELSGATMWGLLNDSSRIGARARILNTIDKLGGVENVALTFGEVDARFHNGRYFYGDRISYGRVYETVARYRRFIEEDLKWSGRVRGHVFVYYGYRYPQGENTLLQPGQPIGPEGLKRAEALNSVFPMFINSIIDNSTEKIHAIMPWGGRPLEDHVSADGVHLVPEKVYLSILKKMEMYLLPPPRKAPREVPI